MNEPRALFPLVREQIHFDTLMQAVHEAIAAYGGQIWTDTAPHDPGITLLEALCYGVSDLSYRTSLPLVDLLTPAPTSGRESIFPSDFAPRRMLTVGPITVNDYRRAILDLYSGDSGNEGAVTTDPNGFFFFRDVQLVRESADDAYTYWFDQTTHTYTFAKPDEPEGATPAQMLGLLGNYTLYLETTDEGEANQAAAAAALNTFLRNNRNLCEMVRKIVWLQSWHFWAQMIIELDEDVQDVAPILAAILQVVTDYVRPSVGRYSAAELRARGVPVEDIYNGPQLRHGWIPDLPPVKDYATERYTIDLSGLPSKVLAIPGVQSITQLYGDFSDRPNGQWYFECKPLEYPQVYGNDPLGAMADYDNVQLYKHGQRYRASKEAIAACMKKPSVIVEAPATLPVGQWRNPARYHPATDWIPPCYDLQNPEPSPATVQLHRFLLPFEQQLANGCQQLAQLPDLLNFQRTSAAPIWGFQWPFETGSVPDEVHAAYKATLLALLQAGQADTDQDLRLIDYLLGYFGAQRAPRTLLRPPAEFLGLQRAYLSELGDLGYHRANIRTDRVSALQKRIAARLGIGLQLFGGIVNMGRLPFYVVENRALLPLVPDTSSSQAYPVAQAEVSGDLLALHTDVAHVAVGELVDLVLDDNATLRTLTVREVESGVFRLSIPENVVLENNLDRVLEAAAAGTLKWHSSNVWLTTMVFQLVYAGDQSGLAANQKRLTTSPLSPFPVGVEPGDQIVIGPGFGPLTTPSAATPAEGDTLTGSMVEVAPLTGTYVIASDAGFPSDDQASKYRWYRNEGVTDRYSFTISIVFERSLLDGVADPAVTEEWMKQVVLSEIPADVGVQFYWFDRDHFGSFAATYKRWLADDTIAGDYAYQLGFQLALGVKPQVELGIGLMKIASSDERVQVVGPQGDEWNVDAILTNNLFYVPASAGSRSLKL